MQQNDNFQFEINHQSPFTNQQEQENKNEMRAHSQIHSTFNIQH